jgi:hypothetical protein
MQILLFRRVTSFFDGGKAVALSESVWDGPHASLPFLLPPAACPDFHNYKS